MSCLPMPPLLSALRCIAVLVIMLATSSAFAHRFAPSALHIEVLPNAEVSVRWKTPIQTVSDLPMVPRLPAYCAIMEQSPFITEGTGKLRQTRYRCEKSLVGESITVDGLAANQSSALLTIVLPDGVSHQAVLTAAEPIWEMPATPDGATVVSRYSVLGAEHIWGALTTYCLYWDCCFWWGKVSASSLRLRHLPWATVLPWQWLRLGCSITRWPWWSF